MVVDCDILNYEHLSVISLQWKKDKGSVPSNNLNDLKKLTWFPYCLPASLDFMRVACKVDTRGRKIVLRSKDLEEN